MGCLAFGHYALEIFASLPAHNIQLKKRITKRHKYKLLALINHILHKYTSMKSLFLSRGYNG